jgi:ribonuclease HII
VARLAVAPSYVLSDGFPVDGLRAPSLAVWKGDRVAGCVAAASVIAKVTRDRIMTGYHDEHPDYRFDVHKGYITPLHEELLTAHGPSAIHRWCFVNVRRAAAARSLESPPAPPA